MKKGVRKLPTLLCGEGKKTGNSLNVTREGMRERHREKER